MAVPLNNDAEPRDVVSWFTVLKKVTVPPAPTGATFAVNVMCSFKAGVVLEADKDTAELKVDAPLSWSVSCANEFAKLSSP